MDGGVTTARREAGERARGNRATGLSGRATVVDVLLICLLAPLVMFPALIPDLPTGHSWNFNIAWYESFRAGVLSGDLYPRWMPDLWNGAGAPDFFFYAPLPFYIFSGVEALLCQGCEVDRIIDTGGIVMMAFSGIALRQLALRFVPRHAALAGAVIFMAMPYHLGAEWFDRGSVGEFLAFAILPVQLAALLDWLDGRPAPLRLGLSTAALFLTHLPSTVVFFVFYVFLVPLLAAHEGRWRRLGGPVAAGVLGIGVAGLFLVPAIGLSHWMDRRFAITGFYDPQNWLLTPDAWETLTVFYRSVWLPYFVSIAVCLGGAALLWRRQPVLSRIGLAAAAATLFMSLPVSSPVWRVEPFIYVQFPFRYFVVSDTAAALLGAALVARSFARPASLGAGVLVVLVLGTAIARHPMVRPLQAIFDPTAWNVTNRAGPEEYLPTPASGEQLRLELGSVEAIRDMPRIALEAGATGQVEVIEDRARQVVFRADLPEPAMLRIKKTWWPVWRLTEDGTGREIPLGRENGFPLITARLSAGEAVYRLELPRLWQEKAGAAASLVSLLLLIGWQAALRRRAGPGRSRGAASGGSRADSPRSRLPVR